MSSKSQSPFIAEVDYDPAIEEQAIHLLYRDQNDPAHNISIGIAPELGSNMFRLRVGEHDLIYCEPELLKRRDFTGNFVLWPLPNRISEKRYTYQGQSYSLQEIKRQQGNAVLIHGLVFDQPWQFEQPIVTPDNVSVTTYVDIAPGSPHYKSYPFDSRLSLTYTLTKEQVTITYNVRNNGVGSLPFGFALHPYFSAPRDQDITVRLPAEAVMEADDELLPTGRVFDVNKIMYAMYDLRQPRPVNCLLLDHVYTHLNQGEPTIIDYRQQQMQLHISASDDFTHIVLYVPPDAPYICLEHQTCATDAINMYQQGPRERELAHLLEVAPGATFSGSLHYALKYT